jgi:hypothetical protein
MPSLPLPPSLHSRTMAGHDLTTKVHREQLYPFAYGGQSDVYHGQYVDDLGRVREV